MNSIETKARYLLDRYYRGETTIAEEEYLKEYFTNCDIPDDLQADREVFVALGYTSVEFTHGLEKELLYAIEKAQNEQKKQTKGRIVRLVSTWAAAASVVIIIGLSWFFTQDSSEVMFADTFDDPYLAMQETQRVLALVGAKISMAKDEIKPLQKLSLPAEALGSVGELSKNMRHLEKINAMDKPKEMPFIKHIFDNQQETNN